MFWGSIITLIIIGLIFGQDVAIGLFWLIIAAIFFMWLIPPIGGLLIWILSAALGLISSMIVPVIIFIVVCAIFVK